MIGCIWSCPTDQMLRLNGRAGGELRDAEFARRYIGIWLGEKASQPALRQSLLGGVRSAR